jgi:hypothetical protein
LLLQPVAVDVQQLVATMSLALFCEAMANQQQHTTVEYTAFSAANAALSYTRCNDCQQTQQLLPWQNCASAGAKAPDNPRHKHGNTNSCTTCWQLSEQTRCTPWEGLSLLLHSGRAAVLPQQSAAM